MFIVIGVFDLKRIGYIIAVGIAVAFLAIFGDNSANPINNIEKDYSFQNIDSINADEFDISAIESVIADINKEKQTAENPSFDVSDNTARESESKEQLVYKTDYGSKYHNYGCRYLKKSCIETTIDAAKGIGLTPCNVCMG